MGKHPSGCRLVALVTRDDLCSTACRASVVGWTRAGRIKRVVYYCDSRINSLWSGCLLSPYHLILISRCCVARRMLTQDPPGSFLIGGTWRASVTSATGAVRGLINAPCCRVKQTQIGRVSFFNLPAGNQALHSRIPNVAADTRESPLSGVISG